MPAEPNSAAPLRDIWYYAMPSAELKPGKLIDRLYLGEPIVFGRDAKGVAFALRDVCPHRGIPLRFGQIVNGEVECPFHGWRFESGGHCTLIPSLTEEQSFDPGRIKVKAYPVREVQGNLWIFIGDDPYTAPEIPLLPDFAADRRPNLTMSMRVACGIDAAVFGQMDPSHNAFVHVSWWWRKARQMQKKAKAFGPAPYGFTMLPHRPSSNINPYKLLGGERETQIIFRLPSTRMELTKFGRRHCLSTISTVTPTRDGEVEMCYAAYWTQPLLTAIRPLLRKGLHIFSLQDREILTKQAAGLAYDPPLLFVDDADTQAKWYHRLKNEYVRSRAENRPFVNPVKERVLHFQS